MGLPVIIVGAGVTGLACARELQRRGESFLVLEARERLGGRVASHRDAHGIVDHGFQVLLSSYEEPWRYLDRRNLQLRSFLAGAKVLLAPGKLIPFPDPFRRPGRLLAALSSTVASLPDKLRLALLRRRLLQRELGQLFAGPDLSTTLYLEKYGFSERVRESFFKPFFGGVFLDSELATSGRLFEFLFASFARGVAELPLHGMGMMIDELAAPLPPQSVRCEASVRALSREGITLTDGTSIDAKRVVLATDGRQAAKLLPQVTAPPWRGTIMVSFLVPKGELPPALREPELVLNGSGSGQINLVAPVSAVQPRYGTESHSMVYVSFNTFSEQLRKHVVRVAREELRTLWGWDPSAWEEQRIVEIPDALPAATRLPRPIEYTREVDGVFVGGDYISFPSLEGAFRSGRALAERVCS